MFYNWSPEIGDPTPMGWITVAFYFVTAILVLRKAIVLRKNRTDFKFWSVLAIFLFALGVNKQLDLQSFFTEVGRVIAKKNGWYEGRRSVQFLFVIIFGAAAFAVIVTVWLMLRKKWRLYLIPLTGFLVLVSFIVIRAASFHHFDVFLKRRFFGAKMNWILELGGTGILFYSSLVKSKSQIK